MTSPPAATVPGEPLRRPGFRRYWSASTLGFIGLAMTTVAVDALIINDLEATESQVGMIRAVQFLPYLLFGLIAGALLDRRHKLPVLVWTTWGTAAALAVIPVLWWLDQLSLVAVGAALFCAGSLGVFTAAAQQSFLPDLVVRGELVPANARLGQSMTTAQTVGPSAGGAAVSVLGAPFGIMIGSLAHVVSAVMLMRVKVSEFSPRRDETQRPSIVRDIRAGVHFTYRHRTLTPLALSTHLWFVANSAGVTVFALYALRHLELSVFLYGTTLALAGISGVFGAVLAPRIGRRLGEGNAVILARLLCAPAWLLVVLAPVHPLWGVAMLGLAQMVHGFSMGLDDPNEMGFRQAVTPRELLGRVGATMRSINRTMAVVGSLLGGLAAGALGYDAALWGVIAIFLVSAVGLALSPHRGARAT
ncbi:MFS transporter [Bogoriella caseilytica]|uniref:Putative MFS family arabinose efflux permease n=1 Tax=Bogoriella caseilytica TaxID=56055 RepID=A0A3N2BC66_9MICO|nr:MFS transporter [Bogoriella caseilytica]ROR72818.1 putative MFS family arabinose efflux permease [Bogoriella caseilytica]